MPPPPAGPCEGSCPFIDRDDPRCAQRFSIRQLDQVFSLCLNDPHACGVYQQLAWEQRPGDTQPPIPTLTVNGEAIGQFTCPGDSGAVALRPTGS